MKLVTSKKQGGFTLVELVMVIVVIALLSAYIGPKFGSIEKHARAAQVNKISGSIAEAIQVAKATSVVELDAFVPEAATGGALTAIDFDGADSTQNATTTNVNGTVNAIPGEDVSTAFHYPVAISSVAPAAAGAGGGTDIAATDSVLNALVAFGSTVTVYRTAADTEATLTNLRADCPSSGIDNDGDTAAMNTFIAYETQQTAVTSPGTADRVTVFPCSQLGQEDTAAITDADALTTDAIDQACYVRYTDAGSVQAATLDLFVTPTVTAVTTGC